MQYTCLLSIRCYNLSITEDEHTPEFAISVKKEFRQQGIGSKLMQETKKMVMENICFLLNQFIRCSAYENIIFCWVMHEQTIIDEILSKPDIEHCLVHIISLICDADELRKRLQKDVDAGIRSEDAIHRSIARVGLYEDLDTEKIDVSHITPGQAAESVLNR